MLVFAILVSENEGIFSVDIIATLWNLFFLLQAVDKNFLD